MAESNPLQPTQDKVQRLHDALTQFMRAVLSKLTPMLKSYASFMKDLQKSAKELAAKVGKSTVNKLIAFAKKLEATLPAIDKLVREALKFGAKIISTIAKAADPKKAIALVKKMIARYASLFRKIVTKVAEVLSMLGPIEFALSIISTFATVLRLIISWITDVTGAASAVKKCKKLMKTAEKTLKKELKTVTDMVKDVGKLKPA